MSEEVRLTLMERGNRLMLAFGVLAGLASVVGLFGVFWWPFEVLSHFRVQYAVIMTVMVLLSLIRRQMPLAAGFGLLVGLNLWIIGPYLVPRTPVAAGNRPVFTAVALNVHTSNHRYESVREYLRRSNPDLFVLTEVDPVWLREMMTLEKEFPCVVSHPRLDNFGIAVYSRLKPTRAEIVNLVAGEVPSAFIELEWQGTRLSFLGTHPLPPRNSEYSLIRNLQFDAIASFMAPIAGPKMVLGDMNATPWSFKFQELLQRTGLRDSALGFGVQNTWPQNVLAFRIPIDHALISSHLQVIERTVGGDVGSDHFPVNIRFCIADGVQETKP